jgi:hypothetical protein
MTEVSEEEAEAEADNLRLEIKILDDENYDIETTNTVDKLLGLNARPIQRQWYRDKFSQGGGRYGTVHKDCWKKEKKSKVLEMRAVKIIEKEKIKPKRHDPTDIEGWKPEIRALIHFSQPRVSL